MERAGSERAAAFSPRTFLLLPTMACQASCRYCFSEHTGVVMTAETLMRAADWIELLAPRADGAAFTVVFHGGEPLLAGRAFYENALALLSARFGRRVRFSIQSNLWALTEDWLPLLSAYGVHVSTSLDGERRVTDAQRGEGYFSRTMRGVELLRKSGMPPSCIATVTRRSLPHLRESIDFFADEGLGFTMRPAVASLTDKSERWRLSAAETRRMYETALAYLSAHPEKARVRDIEAPVAGARRGYGGVCTLSGCLGRYLAVGPDGTMYPCQRFCGSEAYALGSVYDAPDAAALLSSAGYARLNALFSARQSDCGDCRHRPYCHGGCLYGLAAAKAHGEPPTNCSGTGDARAYRALFDGVERTLASEMCAVMLHTGEPTPYLAMAGDTPHPADAAENKRRFLTARAWGEKGEKGAPPYAVPTPSGTRQLYLNITERCPLRCGHCSVSAEASGADMPQETVRRVISEAAENGFSALSLNGGEPLVHPAFWPLCAWLTAQGPTDMRRILNTNLYPSLTDGQLACLRATFDEIVVSLDGGEARHDARRGQGAFSRTVGQLKRLVAAEGRAKVSVRAALTREERTQHVGDEVRAAANALGVTSVYVNAVLPVGRAACMPGGCAPTVPVASEAYFSSMRPLHNSCGLGENLHVTADGNAYPCWAMIRPEACFGNVRGGLGAILAAYRAQLPQYTVDGDPRCRDCEDRYLCGGVCRGFTPPDCTARKAAFDALTALAKAEHKG